MGILSQKEVMPLIYILALGSGGRKFFKEKIYFMNISKYEFHDGYIMHISHKAREIKISMESAEISDEEIKEKNFITLSKHRTIKGILHIKKVKNIEINGMMYSGKLNQTEIYESGDISSFEIKGHTVLLKVVWVKPYERTDLDIIKIEAEEIYWENIPDLFNPDWV